MNSGRRIGRTTRRLTLLREYRRGRCRVRCRCRSSQNAVEMRPFGAGNHESISRRRGGSSGAGSEAQRGRDAARAQSGWGRGWGGWEFRAGRTQRRCAGVIDAAGLARGELAPHRADTGRVGGDSASIVERARSHARTCLTGGPPRSPSAAPPLTFMLSGRFGAVAPAPALPEHSQRRERQGMSPRTGPTPTRRRSPITAGLA